MKRKLSQVLSILILILLILPLAVPVSAKSKTVTETVSLTYVTKNQRGDGYVWDNMTNTLTLDGVNIDTQSEYGLKLPKEATVVLKGNNYISASSCAVHCLGMVTFKGNGSLTVVSGDIGIQSVSLYKNELIRINNCDISITAENTGIDMNEAKLALIDGELSINITGQEEGRRAISGTDVSLTGGIFSANAPVYASQRLYITNIDATVSSSVGAALQCPVGVELDKVSVQAGEYPNSLTEIPKNEYGTQSCIKLKSTASNAKRGILFNAVYPRVFDYLIFLIIILAIAALITVPVYLKKKKTEKLIAEYEAANPPKKKKNSPTKKKQ